MRVKPGFDSLFEASEFSLIAPEYRDVIHVPDVMFASIILPNHPIKWLQDHICEPVRGIIAREKAVLDNRPYEIKGSAVFDDFA